MKDYQLALQIAEKTTGSFGASGVKRNHEVIENANIYYDWLKDKEKQEMSVDVENFKCIDGDNFIKWIYNRMKNVYGEKENIDYMLKLKLISDKIDENI
jgi:hypothetical protein